MVDHNESGHDWLDRRQFPFQSRFLETRFGRVHYVDEGPRDGEVVLLVHGTPSWSFEYRHLIPVLARTRRVIAVDHLGFGLSERPTDFPYTPEAHTQVLREVIDGLGLTRFALAVHDYGGPIALPIAEAEPERISSLVVMNTWFWDLETDREFLLTRNHLLFNKGLPGPAGVQPRARRGLILSCHARTTRGGRRGKIGRGHV